MGKLIVFVLVCGVVWLYIKSKSDGKKRNNSASQSPMPVVTQKNTPRYKQSGLQVEKTGNEQAEIWFSSIIAELEKGTLAYCIFRQAWNLNLPVEKIEELQRQYGKMSLPPSIIEFEDGFQEHGLTVQSLNRLGVSWLQREGISATEANWEKTMNSWCLEQQQKKAEKILAALK